MLWLGWSIWAFVPTICGLRGEEMFCNTPQGYTLYAVTADGGERVVDSATGPTRKRVVLDLRDGETLVLRVK